MDENIQKKFNWIEQQIKGNDPNEILGEIYIHFLENLNIIESLKNCDNCSPAHGDNSCKACKRDSFRMHDNKNDNWQSIKGI